MKKETKDKVKNVTLSIIKEVARIAEGLPLVFIDRKELHKRMDGEFESEKFFANLASLKQRGYIEEDKSGSIRLTNKGRIKYLENSNDESTDGAYRMLSFDIPEEYRRKRDQFRRSIKRIGFKQVQKSLWACPFIKADEVELIIKELELNEYVAYLLVTKTDINNHLELLFMGK